MQYDPWDWVTYRNSQFVSSITEGREYIYLATNGGIQRYHIFGKYWDHPITRSQGLSHDDVRAVYYDFHTQLLWAATPSDLNYSPDGGRRWTSVSRETLGLRPGERIIRIGSTQDHLWCMTTGQIMKLDHLSGFVITPYATLSEEKITWGSAPSVGYWKELQILNDFVATAGWINEVDLLRGPHMEEVYVSTVYEDRFGDLWVGTWAGPVFFGDGQMRQLVPLITGPAQTDSEVLIETDRGMWIGGIARATEPTGITLFDVDRLYWDWFRSGYEIQSGEDQIYCGTQVGDEWWLGTPGGIEIYDPEDDSWFLLPEGRGLKDSRVTSIAFDGNYVYAGSPQGLSRISPVSKERADWNLSRSFQNLPVRALHWDGSSLWISTDLGIWRWNAGTQEIRSYGSYGDDSPQGEEDQKPAWQPLLSTIAAIVSSDSMVYFGDELGLLAFNRTTQEWTRLTAQSQLVGLEILFLELSEGPDQNDDLIWVGTTNGVLAVNLSNGYTRHFTVRDGLPSNVVRSVIVRNDVAWFGTPEGLVRFKWRKYLK
ncbi:MAG: two-component regulator propeller domain-containing protein [Fidelibacterota bacterium]